LLLMVSVPADAGAKETARVLKPAVLRGRVLVQDHCAGCHNAGAKGRSVYAAAPPLRELAGRYPPLKLMEVLEDVQGGNHYAMPRTVVTPREALDIAAYIEALARADRKTRRKLSVPSCVGRMC
jgi:mono/diheme cytochrome c family protein